MPAGAAETNAKEAEKSFAGQAAAGRNSAGAAEKSAEAGPVGVREASRMARRRAAAQVHAMGPSRKWPGRLHRCGALNSPAPDDARSPAAVTSASWNSMQAQNGHGRLVEAGVGRSLETGDCPSRGSAGARWKCPGASPGWRRAAGEGSFGKRRLPEADGRDPQGVRGRNSGAEPGGQEGD